MNRGRGRLRLAAVAASLVAVASLAAQEHAPRFQGLPLSAALARLQEGGLRVMFSSDLVRPTMVVAAEPRGAWPHEILAELLAPHGLRSVRGPSGVWLVVRASPAGSIAGTVRLAGGGALVPGVRVIAVGRDIEAWSDAAGRFELGPLPAGSHTVEVRGPGFLPRRVEAVPVVAGSVTELQLELNPRSLLVEEIVVRPDDPGSRAGRPAAPGTLRDEDLSASPEHGDDPLLAVGRLPGVTSTEGSGALNVRGGAGREVKFVLDGLELYEPYHLRERGGPIGIVDSRDLGAVGLLSAAFPAEHGGRMGAVIEMDSLVPQGRPQTTVALSTGDSRIASRGRASERVGWLASARNGDPSRLLDALQADPAYRPTYWDVFGKLDTRPSDRTTVSLNLLLSADITEGDDDSVVPTVDEPGTFRSLHASHYAWLTLAHAPSQRILLRTVLSAADLTSKRDGSSPRVSLVEDSRSTALVGLKQDALLLTGRHSLKFGLEARHLRASYVYSAVPAGGKAEAPLPADPISLALEPDGTELGVYLADRVQAAPWAEVELGLRWDGQTYTPDRGTLGPRVNAVFTLGDRTRLRIGWGQFAQHDRIHELQVEDGVDEFLPAERAEHRLVAIERSWIRGLALEVSAYQKRMSQLNPRFENLFDPFGFFPEADGDRVRIAPQSARAEGLEGLARGPAGRRASWWGSYAVARAEDRIDGAWIARSWDQRHSLGAGFHWRPADPWDLAIAGAYHSGRPTTPVTAEPVTFGPRNSLRLPAYQRIDVRASRTIPLGATALRATLTVTNVLDRANPCCVDGFDYVTQPGGAVTAEPRLRDGLPRLVTFGVAWTF